MEKVHLITISLLLIASFYSIVQSIDASVTKSHKCLNITDAEREKFYEWKEEKNKTYKTPEAEEKALKNFVKALRKIESFNNQMNKTYSQSYDPEFIDKDPEKFIREQAGFKIPKNVKFSTLPNDDDDGSNSGVEYDASTTELTSSTTKQKIVKSAQLKDPKTTKITTLKTTTFKTTTSRRKPSTIQNARTTPKITTTKAPKLPTSVNYTKYMQSVMEQGQCGSCYIISSVALVEYDSKVNRNINQTLSSQNVLDCINDDDPCSGGWPGVALDFVKYNGVADGSKGKYVYTGIPQSCNKTFTPLRNISNWCSYFLSGNEYELQKLVAKQPVVVGVSLTFNMMYYKKGVFYDEACTNNIDHAVVVVGYGTDGANGDYWIIRNSWGINWGVKGYGLFSRNRNNSCGIANVAFTLC
ncbi:hypothetical protein PVAND_012899 [Polypedilum vanderplanki]|uniref:Peptidase C1A papain C-terminal domain-containing protein n=1 Tax=Polypedilum vanderplanki TaxID=319348 RepID=A0A9J6CMW1_POLVA|nr:hypothetical protein PVAND_012899 [Polypedilum vanderplanki]